MNRFRRETFMKQKRKLIGNQGVSKAKLLPLSGPEEIVQDLEDVRDMVQAEQEYLRTGGSDFEKAVKRLLGGEGTSMAKTRATFAIDLPAYIAPRTCWRRLIYAAVARGLRAADISCAHAPSLELGVQLRLNDSQLALHDVDNRLKDIMDALQGCLGGAGKKKRTKRPLIPNDKHIFRVVIQKTTVSPKASPGGTLKIMRLKKARVVFAA